MNDTANQKYDGFVGELSEERPASLQIDGSKVECSDCVQKSKELKEWEEKFKELKKIYVKLTVRHAELDLKYNDLLKSKSATSAASDVVANANAASEDGVFNLNELKFLQCMPLDKKKDSTFIHQCLQFAYKNDLGVLAHKSLKGTSDWIEINDRGEKIHHTAKSPISPHKVNRIKEVFVERISKCQISSVEYGDRVKDANINKLFAGGIKNIAKKQH